MPNDVVVFVGKFVVVVAKPLAYTIETVLGVQIALRVRLLEVTYGDVTVVPPEVFQPANM